MELWVWVACLLAGQLIGVALCLLPQQVVAARAAFSTNGSNAEDPPACIPAMWSDIGGLPAYDRGEATATRDRSAA